MADTGDSQSSSGSFLVPGLGFRISPTLSYLTYAEEYWKFLEKLIIYLIQREEFPEDLVEARNICRVLAGRQFGRRTWLGSSWVRAGLVLPARKPALGTFLRQMEVSSTAVQLDLAEKNRSKTK